MPENAKLEPITSKGDEERLAHALISRGLVTREEMQLCSAAGAAGSAEALLKLLVKERCLTPN